MEDRQHLHKERHVTVEVLKESLADENRGVSPRVQETPVVVEQSLMDGQKLAIELEKLRLKNRELEHVIELRRSWSSIFRVIVLSVLIFEILLTLAVGAKLLRFEDEWFLRIIVLGGISQILAMPYLVTKFLFNTDSSLSKGE